MDPTGDERIDGVPVDELVALLSMPPEEFVSARTARAKELRAEGRRDDAAALVKLRKPVRLVWAVGEVARRDPASAAEASAVAGEADEAMAGRGDVRIVLERFRSVVRRVADAGTELQGAVDRAEFELALREVLADPVARAAWEQGRLLRLPGGVSAPADELAPRRARRRAAQRQATAERVGGAQASWVDDRARADAAAAEAAPERQAKEAERRAHDEAREEARSLLTDARRRARSATTEHDAANATLHELEERLVHLRAAVDRARLVADEAAGAVDRAEDDVRAAEAALRALEDH